MDVEIDYIGNVDWDRGEKPFRNYYLLEYTGFLDKKKIPGQLLEELRDNKYDLILLPYSLYGSTTYKNLLRIADQIKPLHILQYHDHGPEKLKTITELRIRLWIQSVIFILAVIPVFLITLINYIRALLVKYYNANRTSRPLDSVQVIGGTTRLQKVREIVQPNDNGVVKIGCIARLDPIKGHRYLLEAAQLLIQDQRQFEILLIGGGPEADSLKSFCEQKALTSFVRFLGFQADIRPYLELCDMFVLPSLNEAMPISLIEIMAAEKPLIATKTGSIPYIIEDGVNGLLVSPASSVELAAALKRLMDNPDERAQLGMNAYRYYRENLSPNAFCKKHMEIYETVVDAPNRPIRTIVTTIFDMTIGGLQSYIELLQTCSSHTGFQVQVMSLGMVNLNLRVMLLIHFHKIFAAIFPKSGEIAAFTCRQMLLRYLMLKILRSDQKPDVVHVHDVMGYHALAPLCRWFSVPLILTKHGDLAKEVAAYEKVDKNSFVFQYFDYLEHKAYREAKHLVVVDQESKIRIERSENFKS